TAVTDSGIANRTEVIGQRAKVTGNSAVFVLLSFAVCPFDHAGFSKGPALVALALLLAAGCEHPDRGGTSAGGKAAGAGGGDAEGKTAGIRVVRPELRDIRMTVVQPGTIQAFEVTPVFSRISGYVAKYRYNIGDRVKAGDVLIDMWIPDLVEAHEQ